MLHLTLLRPGSARMITTKIHCDVGNAPVSPRNEVVMGEKPIKLLLIEDDSADRLLVEHSLRKSVIQIDLRFAESIDSAMPILKYQKPDVVVSDLNFPDCNLQTTIKLMGRINSLIPVILISGCAGFDVEEQIINAGFKGFVNKSSFVSGKLCEQIISAAKRIPANIG